MAIIRLIHGKAGWMRGREPMLSQKGNNIGFSNLAGILAVIILFIGIFPGNAPGAETSWIFDANTGISHFDNVNNASSTNGKKSDDVTFLSLSGGSYFQIAGYTGLTVAVDLKNEVSANYSGLSLLAAGISLRISHKMGLGPSAVRLNAYTSASNEEYGDKDRNSILYKTGISGSRWIDDRVKVGLGYEFDKRAPKNNYELCTGGYGGNCQLATYASVYDIQGHSGIAFAEVTLTEKDTAFLSYRYRSGDVVSVDLPAQKVLGASSAVSPDGVFPGLTAYRISAVTQTGFIGISRELIRKMSLNLNYSFNVASGKGGVDYQSNVINLIAAYSF